MKPTERDIHMKMIDTLSNMLSAERIKLRVYLGGKVPIEQEKPSAIQELVREIAERELKEKP